MRFRMAFFALVLVGCATPSGPIPQETDDNLVGAWKMPDEMSPTIELSAGGSATYSMGTSVQRGEWGTRDGSITISVREGDSLLYESADYTIANDQLSFTDAKVVENRGGRMYTNSGASPQYLNQPWHRPGTGD